MKKFKRQNVTRGFFIALVIGLCSIILKAEAEEPCEVLAQQYPNWLCKHRRTLMVNIYTGYMWCCYPTWLMNACDPYGSDMNSLSDCGLIVPIMPE